MPSRVNLPHFTDNMAEELKDTLNLPVTDFPMRAGLAEREPLRIAPARVSDEIEARGRDIYGRSGANRQVLELAAALAPGDSGSPMVNTDGSVIGQVFAVATDRSNVAYALTVGELEAVLQTVSSSASSVDTGVCLG